MDIRNVQKTGNMHYVYLPTSWCKKHKITSSSKLTLRETSQGALTLLPHIKEKTEKNIVLNLSETNLDIIHKLIIACYINPTSSFKINLQKEINSSAMLNERKLISLENVEINNRQISCESTVTVSDPASLLKTMVGKIKNLLVIMLENYSKDIINRYEEEIDKSKLLIEKSVVSSLTFTEPTNLKLIDLYYISTISKELERIVDNLIVLDKKEKELLNHSLIAINSLKEILEGKNLEQGKKLEHSTAIEFVKRTLSMQNIEIKSNSKGITNIANSFINISDVILDWSITNQLEESSD